MVNFTVFNELSLPFINQQQAKSSFIDFFKLLRELNNRDLKTIRMDSDFKNYEIVKNLSFQEFFGQIDDKDLKDRLREFITNSVIKIDSPLIKDNEINEKEEIFYNEYLFNNSSTIGGLACADIWNTIAISFNSNTQWNQNIIILQKHTIENEEIIIKDINIKHASNVTHLNLHNDFFEELESEKRLNITLENFWERREELFPNKIIFCEEVKKQIQNLDKLIFQQSIRILRDIESDKKLITDYNISGEKETVKDNPKMKKERTFTVNDKKVFFEKHLKSLPNANRIYFLKIDEKIYIGYIGKHLTTKKYR